MTSSELMLSAIANGQHDDTTVSAALDALRERDGWTLLGAVCEVARVWQAFADSRDITEAVQLLGLASPVRAALRRAVVDECVDLPSGVETMVVVVEGDRCPSSSRDRGTNHTESPDTYIVSVGALWVKRVASRLQLEREREARRPRRRRSS